MSTKKRKDFTLCEEALAVLDQLKTIDGTKSYSQIIESLLLEKGIKEGILEISDSKRSMLLSREISYNVTGAQTKFEMLLSQNMRRLAEQAESFEKETKKLEKKFGSIDAMLYTIADAMNSMIIYTQRNTADEFKSADRTDSEYTPSKIFEISAEHYRKKAERAAVEKANDGQRYNDTNMLRVSRK